jgi:hypothetical protein
MWEAIDVLVDSKSAAKYIPWERSEPKEQPLPFMKTLDGHARRWMVSKEWLKENRDQDTPKQLADSGKLWGDEFDLEESEARLRKAVEEKAEYKRSKQARISDASTLVEEFDKQPAVKRVKKGKGKAKERLSAKKGESAKKILTDHEGGSDDGFD